MDLWGLISWVVFGLLAGIVAKFLMPGRDPGGCIITSLIGIAGAVLGGFIATALGFGGVATWDLYSFVIAVLGAILLLFLYRMLRGKKTR
ncbi:MAG TPA: GlsB/YeaQ/YmgE family stress response membrane protein [Thermoanaerobaculia bacterium]|nr:GlsB/YeaQ/YmgE family stress response membrane protein [Thermoanaerobaculia bacterium]